VPEGQRERERKRETKEWTQHGITIAQFLDENKDRILYLNYRNTQKELQLQNANERTKQTQSGTKNYNRTNK